jgi:hypothetical protein
LGQRNDVAVGIRGLRHQLAGPDVGGVLLTMVADAGRIGQLDVRILDG